MQVPLQMVNDIFLTHVHVDHYGELPYLFASAPWAARWKPLRVYGPAGRTPEDGTQAMVDGMRQMAHWYIDSFNSSPIGDGFESWSYVTDRLLSLDRLRKVAAKLPADICRAKGVAAVSEAPGRRAVLQVVGKRVDVALDGEWGRQPPRTQIVAIGAAGAMGPGDLKKHFAACLAEVTGDGGEERGLPC